MGSSTLSHRILFILLAIGLVLMLCSLAALAYAFAPVDILQVKATLAPTLMAPP